ncbi:MAG: TlpA disulfide reductase family protein [Candidatus Nanopelagicales bacterium]|nr:TlpA disulfide reductase family protein [Candidatus Nanopelagicales bacterium]
MKFARTLNISVVLICAAILLSACASTETAGELIRESSADRDSSEVMQGELKRDSGLLALMQEVNLDPCPTQEPNPDTANPGLPDQVFDCLGDSSQISLAKLRGMPMVINVWASWCPPCIAELPLLEKMSQELTGQVDFIGINLEDNPTKALQLMQDFDIKYPSVFDPAGDTRAPLTILGPPVTYFVTSNGIIAGRWDGAIPDQETFDTLLKQFLGVTP